ncbi:MAG: Holliday junction resolvase RuvX [Candidatus Sungbacteria bacterium]|nr:Holliday junction resolvase RuvX [Candidatus Sungbacteria bacterium]
MKYLGLDYGRARVGVAVSDDEGKMAFPRSVLLSQPEEKLFKSLAEISEAEKIKTIVLGMPPAMPDVDQSLAGEIKEFSRKLRELGMEVLFENEMFTTRIAEAHSKKDTDASAAALILQSFLDRKNKIE